MSNTTGGHWGLASNNPAREDRDMCNRARSRTEPETLLTRFGGGWLTDSYDWRWVFFINVPVGAMAFYGIWRYIRKTEDQAQNGAEYTTLKTPQPVQAQGKKVEVIEFFMYHCPACYALEPAMLEWVKKQGDNISFRRIHIFTLFYKVGLTEINRNRKFISLEIWFTTLGINSLRSPNNCWNYRNISTLR